MSVRNADIDRLQIEKGTTATTYEPYKSSILTFNEPVKLRSLPNGIKDTINVVTGEYVQRVGEVVLDETLGWVKGGWNNSYRQELYLNTSNSGFDIASGYYGDSFLCDTFKSVNYYFSASNPEGMGVGINAGGFISVYIHKDKLTVNSFISIFIILITNIISFLTQIQMFFHI
jgi:hypothetical protein